jgi:hypothetical protein
VLVKEVFDAATGKMATGTVSRAEKLKDWFVMMKDKGQLSRQPFGAGRGLVQPTSKDNVHRLQD